MIGVDADDGAHPGVGELLNDVTAAAAKPGDGHTRAREPTLLADHKSLAIKTPRRPATPTHLPDKSGHSMMLVPIQRTETLTVLGGLAGERDHTPGVSR